MVVFLGLASVLGPWLLAAPRASAVTVGPGVIFQPSASWSNISFASSQTFSSLRVDATGVTFDSVRLGMAKSPTTFPRATAVISTWTPLLTASNLTVVGFSGDAPTGASLAFSLSGVVPAREYVLQVDGTEVAREFSNQTGFVPFTWSNFSAHAFAIVLGWRTGLPPPPTPLSVDFAYAPSNPLATQAIAFTAAAAGGYTPYAYAWAFGDGGTASGATATHAYAFPGNYTVSLHATDQSGAVATAAKTVRVLPAPPATLSASIAFTPGSPQATWTVNFTSAVSGGTPPYTYAWEFGDGATGTSAAASHAYAAAGAYTVNLTVHDAASGSAIATTQVNVTPYVSPPAALTADFAYAPASPVAGQTVTFTAAASGAMPPYAFAWTFGDGGTASGATAGHAYASAGNYTVVLTVTDQSSTTATVSMIVPVLPTAPPPPALSASIAFTPSTPEATRPVNFTSAVSGGSPPYTYAWSFGDGGTASSSSVVHAYASAGNYTVNLTVEDTASRFVVATSRVTVTAAALPPPGNVFAAFDYAVDGTTVRFTDRSTTDTGLPIVKHSWYFGDDTKSTEAAPVHTYAMGGFFATYTVVLSVEDSAGHFNYTSRDITLVNWTLVLLIVVGAGAVAVAVLVVLLRRRRKRSEASRLERREAARPRTE